MEENKDSVPRHSHKSPGHRDQPAGNQQPQQPHGLQQPQKPDGLQQPQQPGGLHHTQQAYGLQQRQQPDRSHHPQQPDGLHSNQPGPYQTPPPSYEEVEMHGNRYGFSPKQGYVYTVQVGMDNRGYTRAHGNRPMQNINTQSTPVGGPVTVAYVDEHDLRKRKHRKVCFGVSGTALSVIIVIILLVRFINNQVE